MDINTELIANEAAQNYGIGGFYCSEAIIKSFNKHLKMGLGEMAISMTSGFPVGVGRSKCMCGAISGGVMIIGAFFGRNEVAPGIDQKSVKCLELSNEIVDKFKKRNKVCCCSILTKGMDFTNGEHKEQCVRFTKEVAQDVAEILQREL